MAVPEACDTLSPFTALSVLCLLSFIISFALGTVTCLNPKLTDSNIP